MGHNGSKHNRETRSVQQCNSGSVIKPPVPFTDQTEFMQKWFTWKKNFLIFVSQMEKDRNKQGNLLLNYIGPVGQEIHRTFTHPCNTDNITVLLTYFDIYCIFFTKIRKPNENIYQYVQDLIMMAETKGIPNKDEFTKKKIMTEIPLNQFEEIAKTLIPNFKLSSNWEGLTLTEIAFIWELGEKKNTCQQCGENHNLNCCRAQGKQCYKCMQLNHLANTCPSNLINNCVFCGGKHLRGRCPSFNTVCSKCKKPNHFSWKCHARIIQNCRYCGQDHMASRSNCMGNETVCTICKKRGHISARCNQRLHRGRY